MEILNEKDVLVIGESSGIGQAIAVRESTRQVARAARSSSLPMTRRASPDRRSSLVAG